MTGREYRELIKLNINFKDFPPIHLPTHYKVTLLPAFSSLAIRRKLNLSAEQWQQMYSDLQVQCPDRKPVYIDGSVQGGDVGCAVYSEDFKVLSKLPAATSIFTAEIYAIYTAINFLKNRPEKYIIISDSYSSIAAIWVPSHWGLRGNEEADKLAKAAAKLTRETEVPLSKLDFRKLKRYYNGIWQKHWSSKSPLVTSVKRNIGPTTFINLPR